MISKVITFAALFAAAVGFPVIPSFRQTESGSVAGQLASGAGAAATGPAAAVASADSTGSGIAGAVLNGQTGTVISTVTNGSALAASVASPSL